MTRSLAVPRSTSVFTVLGLSLSLLAALRLPWIERHTAVKPGHSGRDRRPQPPTERAP